MGLNARRAAVSPCSSVLSLPAFSLADALYGAVYRATGGTGALARLSRIGLIALVPCRP